MQPQQPVIQVQAVECVKLGVRLAELSGAKDVDQAVNEFFDSPFIGREIATFCNLRGLPPQAIPSVHQLAACGFFPRVTERIVDAKIADALGQGAKVRLTQ